MTGWGEVDEDSCRLRLAWSDKGRHGGLARRLIAVRRRGAAVAASAASGAAASVASAAAWGNPFPVMAAPAAA